MSNPASEFRWISRFGNGTEAAWIERDGQFKGIDIGQGFRAFEELDIEQLEPMCRADGHCDEQKCPAPFPRDFAVCPVCGDRLRPMFRTDRLWSFPGADGDGLLNAESVAIRQVSEPIPGGIPSPGAANVTLFVAGQPRRLLAIDRVNSVFYVFNKEHGKWRYFTSETSFDNSLPPWSWAVYAFNDGFAFAGADGPMVARLNAIGMALELSVPKFHVGKALAGPGSLDGRILFLIGESDRTPYVVTFDLLSREWSKKAEIADLHSPLKEGEFFAAPVVKSPTFFWIGPSGYVAVKSIGADLEIRWRSWSDGFVPELQIRPIWTQQSLWQFGSRGCDLQFEKLSLRGSPAIREVEATHLTAGECSFTSGMKIYATPWDENSSQPVGSGDSFLMPVCGLAGLGALVADCGSDSSQRRVNPSELLQSNAPLRLAKLMIYQGAGSSLDLKRSIRIANLLQLQAIVFDGRLLVYDKENGTIEAWKID